MNLLKTITMSIVLIFNACSLMAMQVEQKRVAATAETRELHEPLYGEDIARIKEALSQGAQINCCYMRGKGACMTPLIAAFFDYNFEKITLFLSIPGLDVNSVDDSGNTALHYAASSHNIEGLNLLLSMPYIKMNLKNKNNATPLQEALPDYNMLQVHKSDSPQRMKLVCDTVILLLEHGADPEIKDSNNRNAYQKASYYTSLRMEEIIQKNRDAYLKKQSLIKIIIDETTALPKSITALVGTYLYEETTSKRDTVLFETET